LIKPVTEKQFVSANLSKMHGDYTVAIRHLQKFNLNFYSETLDFICNLLIIQLLNYFETDLPKILIDHGCNILGF
jgi:hypothetical protein